MPKEHRAWMDASTHLGRNLPSTEGGDRPQLKFGWQQPVSRMKKGVNACECKFIRAPVEMYRPQYGTYNKGMPKNQAAKEGSKQAPKRLYYVCCKDETHTNCVSENAG